MIKEHRIFSLADFKGVDFSTSALRIDKRRASYMENFISENGINKKRNGWNEKYKFTGKINGIWQYVNGSHKCLLVHAGTSLYRILSGVTSTLISGLSDTRSQAFFHSGRVYLIGCGKYLTYGSFDGTYQIKNVLDIAYVPTTTKSIVNGGGGASLDEVNLLTAWRKNTLVGAAYTDTPIEWTLDSYIDMMTDVTITAELSDGVYTIKNNQAEKLKLYKVEKDGVAITPVEVGTLTYAGVDESPSKITLSIDTTPIVEDLPNLTVEFQSGGGQQSLKITNSKFGALFGLDGGTDRLFVGGAYPNTDFHSASDDWTYFPDINYSEIGTSKIMGYIRLTDSTLAILKEPSTQEPTLYYRTGKILNVDEVARVGIFPHTATNIGEGAVSTYALANLSGDSLMLSPNGVYGIVIGENVATVERYTRERSARIRERLIKEDLSDAVAIVYKDKYYLAVGDGVYIADAKHVDNNQYEWWYWTGVPVRVWAVIDDKLMFGDADGRICEFDSEYTDRTYQTTSNLDLSYVVSTSGNKIDFNETVEVSDGDRITFYTPVYDLYMDDVQVDEHCIASAEKIVTMTDGTEVFVDTVDTSGLIIGRKYTIGNIDMGECTFDLFYNDEVVPVASGGFRLIRYLQDKQMTVTNKVLTESEASFQLLYEGRLVTLTSYNGNTPLETNATITHYRNVVAQWYTGVYDFGTNTHSKTMLKMTISTEPEVNGMLNFGYETRNTSKILNAKGINVFSFDNFNFANFSFDTGFANSYSVVCRERNFNYIMFRFVSDNAYNCSINDFSVIYKVTINNKGVR